MGGDRAKPVPKAFRAEPVPPEGPAWEHLFWPSSYCRPWMPVLPAAHALPGPCGWAPQPQAEFQTEQYSRAPSSGPARSALHRVLQAGCSLLLAELISALTLAPGDNCTTSSVFWNISE